MKRVLAPILAPMVALACAAAIASPAAAEPAKETSLSFFVGAGGQSIFISNQPVAWQGRKVSFWMFLAAGSLVQEADGKTYVGAWVNAAIDCTAKASETLEVVMITPNLAPDRRIAGDGATAPIDATKPVERLRAHYCDGRPLGGPAVRAENLAAAVRIAQAGGPPATAP